MSPKNKGTDKLRTLIEDFPLPYIAMFVYRRLITIWQYMFHGNIWPYYYWLLYCHILPCLICLLGFSKVWRHKLVHWSRWRAIESVPRCWDQPPTNQISLPATASDGSRPGLGVNTGSRNDVLFRQNSLVTLWLCHNSYWKWPFIVDFPIKNGDFP